MALSILIAALSLAGLVAQTVVRARTASAPGRITVRSARDPREIRRAARQFFAGAGWQAGAKRDGGRTFVYRVRPAGPEVIILLLLGIVPGVIYLLLGKQTVHVGVTVAPDPAGSATVVTWSNGSEGEQICRDFAAMIRAQEPPRGLLRERTRRRAARRRSAAVTNEDAS